MSANLLQLQAQQYALNIEFLLQQKDSRFGGLVTMGSYKGTQAQVVDQIGAVEMQTPAGRFAPIGRVDAAFDSRWVAPSDFDLPQLADSFDELRLVSDPKSKYVQNAVMAANRKKDAVISSAFFANALTGTAGTTATGFLAGQQVLATEGAASATGLNVAKLRKVRELFLTNQVPAEEPIYMAITAKQHSNLLAESQIISTDYNDRPVLVDGIVKQFMGINFVHYESLPLDGSGYRRCPVWVKSGMHLGMWGGIYTDASQRKDLTGHPYQAYMKMTIGATRIEEKRVAEVKCLES